MKRVIALLLCLSFMLSFSHISAFAEGENYKFARIKVTANKKDYYETVIVDNGTLYMATESIAKYATYNTSKHKLFFMRRDQDDVDKAFKLAYYNESDNTFHVKLGMTWKTIKKVDCKVYQDSYYLPIHMIFPYLDSVVSTDKKSLIIDSDKIALSDALYDYNSLDYYFNMSSEFADNALLATGFYLPSYLFDTSTKIFNWDALGNRLLGANGSYNDYLAAFERLVIDNKAYLKAISSESNGKEEVYELLGDNIDLGKAFDNIREIDEFLDTTFEIGDNSFEFLQCFKGFKELQDYYDLVTLVYNYLNMAEDHYDMIGTVYSKEVLKANNSFEKKEYKAGKKAALIYSNSSTAVFHALQDFSNSQKRDASLEFTNWDELVDATGNILRKELKLGYTENVPLLPYYASIMNSSISACTEYNMKMADSKPAENKMRLSEILYLLSSAKCYEVMLEVYDRYNDKSSVSYYQSQINKINARLILLYQAKDTSESKDKTSLNYSDESKAIKKAIKSMSVKGVSEEDFKYKNLANWKWIVEPSVEADDIQPVLYDDYYVDDNGVIHYNTWRLQAYDKISIIQKNNKYGLVAYNGMDICDTKFFHICYIVNGEKYYGLLGNNNYIIKDHYQTEKMKGNEFFMEPSSALYWISELEGLYDGDNYDPKISYNSKVKYTEPIAVPFVNQINKLSKDAFEVVGYDSYVLVNNGKIITNQQYEAGGVYSDGVIPMKLNGKWGYLDQNGKQILPFDFDSIDESNGRYAYNASNGYIVVKKGNLYAVFDIDGNPIIDYGKFDEIRPVYEGMAWVKQDGKWGVIGLSQDIQGVSIAAPKETTYEIEATVSDKNGVRLRGGPGTDYDVIGILSNKKTVTICGRTDDWSYVKVGSNYGWVKSNLLGVDLTEVSKYNENEIKRSLLYNGIFSLYGDYRYDNQDNIGNFIIILGEKYGEWKKSNTNYFDNFYSESGYEYNLVDANLVDKDLYERFHIKISHTKKNERYNESAIYKDGQYYTMGWGCLCWLPENSFNIEKVTQISHNLIFVTFTNTESTPTDYNKYERSYSNDSAVLYTKEKAYALVEYQKGKQTLSAERYLHYLNDFE